MLQSTRLSQSSCDHAAAAMSVGLVLDIITSIVIVTTSSHIERDWRMYLSIYMHMRRYTHETRETIAAEQCTVKDNRGTTKLTRIEQYV